MENLKYMFYLSNFEFCNCVFFPNYMVVFIKDMKIHKNKW
jgi:hypothetical protein